MEQMDRIEKTLEAITGVIKEALKCGALCGSISAIQALAQFEARLKEIGKDKG